MKRRHQRLFNRQRLEKLETLLKITFVVLKVIEVLIQLFYL